jgi:hypothetical protein
LVRGHSHYGAMGIIVMEERLPVGFAVLQLAAMHDLHQRLFRLCVHRHVLPLRQSNGGQGQELLMAGDAVLATGMTHEGLLGLQRGFLQRRQGLNFTDVDDDSVG